MRTFDEVMQLTRTVSSATALSDVEAKALYDACVGVPKGGLVIEVGCQLGRSSSLIAQVALDAGYYSVHIDPYTDQPDFLKQWHEMMWAIGERDHSYTHLCMRTEQAKWLIGRLGEVDLAFIDGDHEYPGVMIDLQLIAGWIKPSGTLTMHDYGRDSLPGVWKAASEYIDDRWEQVGVFDTLGVWRRK